MSENRLEPWKDWTLQDKIAKAKQVINDKFGTGVGVIKPQSGSLYFTVTAIQKKDTKTFVPLHSMEIGCVQYNSNIIEFHCHVRYSELETFIHIHSKDHEPEDKKSNS